MDILNSEYPLLEDEDENDGVQQLIEGLNIRDLSSVGSEFEVQISEDAALEEQKSYEGPDVFPHLNLQCLGPEENSDCEEETEALYDGCTPFQHLAKKMDDLVPNGKIKKRILVPGYGETVPDNALVWFHHNNYVENNDIPFDSSYLRGRMEMLRLNCGKCILGLELGLKSMKRGEKSELLLHPDYAYGKMGVPDRIPKNAHVLIIVELKKFADNALAIKMGELTDEEVKTMSFEDILKGAENLMQNAKSDFKEKKYPAAIRSYRNGIRLLENCDLKSDDEESKNEELKLKMYTNLGICYNKLNRSKPAIVTLHKALRLSPKDSKILYHLGLAHLNFSSFDEAKKYAFLARKHAPRNPDISNLLRKIEQKMERYNSSMVTFAKSALRFDVNTKTNVNEMDSKDIFQDSRRVKIVELPDDSSKSDGLSQNEEPTTENLEHHSYDADPETLFQQETIGYIEEFVKNPVEKEIALPPNLSYEEQIFLKRQAVMYGLHWDERWCEGKLIVYLMK